MIANPAARPDRFRRLFSPLGQALVLGGTGFIAGYFFPLWRIPDSNLGPLLGIIVTGPVGLACGFLLGVAGRLLNLRTATAASLLTACCAALASIAFLMCKPEDIQIAKLVDGTVLKCSAPVEFTDEVIKHWEDSIAINPQKPVTVAWRDDVRRTLESSSGYVAEFGVERTRGIYSARGGSKRGTIYAAPWVPKRGVERFFVTRQMCAADLKPARSVYLEDWSEWPTRERFPPDDASRLFNFVALKPVLGSYSAWAQ